MASNVGMLPPRDFGSRYRPTRQRQNRIALGQAVDGLTCDVGGNGAGEGVERHAIARTGFGLGHGRTREAHGDAAQHARTISDGDGDTLQSAGPRQDGEGVAVTPYPLRRRAARLALLRTPRSRSTARRSSSEQKASQARPSAPVRIGLRRCNAERSKDIGLLRRRRSSGW